MKLIAFALLWAGVAGQKADWMIPGGEVVISFAGKMNVPRKGTNLTLDHGWVGFWPGLRGKDLFLQPILSDFSGHEQWTMSSQAWSPGGASPTCTPGAARQHCACGSYCHDTGVYHITPGTTISWYMAKKQPQDPTNTDWVSGFSTSTGHSMELAVRFPEGSNSTGHLTALLEEGGYNSLDQAPRDPIEVWDMVVLNSHGQKLHPKWSCSDDGQFSHINCNWKDGSRSGVQILFHT
eukprot:TRINITY_DN6076_c0_g1_i1.p1 TRINITY_DN6076_c0_g1~~TRINITY_DN6076_c0_g1_i1.p1  ORF type:complete len:236 (-),score=38.23 TRINITY_DN6076_c0_g1_i1:37-744(-)